MSYKLDIKDDALRICGLFGTYEAADDGSGGFLVSVQQDSCVNEIDADGEEYLVDFGQEWSVSVKNLSELNGFIKRCEEERLWNYLSGPVFRMKPDMENGILYIRGQNRNFVIGEGDKGLYVDESANTKSHNYKDDLLGITRYMTAEDKWWQRPAEETVDIARNMRCAAMVTSGGNLQLEYRNKSLCIGQKEDGSFWVNVSGDQEKHIFFKDNWKEVIALLGN